MRKKKVRTNYEKLKFDELHTLAGKVVACIKESTVFTDLPMTVEELETHAQDYQTKWEVAKGGSKLHKTLRDEARLVLLETFSRLATYVNHTAQGKISVLVSSGFDLTSDHKPLQITETPVLVRLLDGPQKNQLLLRFQGVKNRSFYEYQYADNVDVLGEPIWGEILQTRNRSTNIIAPTQPGTVYYARVRTRNGVGASDWSAVVSLMAR